MHRSLLLHVILLSVVMPRKVLLTIVFVAVFAGIGLFAWRVLFYYQKVVSGTLTEEDFGFQNRLTVSEASIAALAATTPPDQAEVATDDDPSIGSATARLTIVEFADFGCPYSREVSYTARRLAELYGNDVRYIYRDFPLTDLHPGADLAAEAGECAQDQDQFWSYHDKLYQNQHDLSRDSLVRYADEIGLDTARFASCLDTHRYQGEVQADLEDGQAAGVYGTPTFFWNGNRIEGAIPEDVFEALINGFLEAA